MVSPSVSMFLPTFARMDSGMLPRAVDSALRQRFDDFELLVVDDASTDGSADYLREVAERDNRVKVLRLDKNTGLPAYALAQAYALSRGRIFAWLFDDCELEPDHLERLVEALEAHPNAAMAYGKARARLSVESNFEIGAPLDMAALEGGANMIPNVCVAVRREIIEAIGWYDHHVLLKRLCDWDLWRRIAREREVVFVDQVLATEHGVGLALSLGRMFHTAPDLVVRYAAMDRRNRLSPESLRLEDAFEVPPDLLLDDAERAQAQFILFEHALMLGDAGATARTAAELMAGGSLKRAAELFSAQNERTPDAADTPILAATELLRRRLADCAQRQIDAEIEARATLDVAEERFRMVEDSSARIESLLRDIGALQAQIADLQGLAAARLQELETSQQAAEAEGRIHAATVEQLVQTTQTLFVYRDAADQRMALLVAANQRIEQLEEATHASAKATTDTSPVGQPPTSPTTLHPAE